jgi:Glyoxalase/Bleomycin resistance protein/Dioxygenase superfamily
MSGLVVMSPSPKPIAPNPRPVDPGVSIGHVHLKVADLNRAIAFYCGVLGFDLMQRSLPYFAIWECRRPRLDPYRELP